MADLQSFLIFQRYSDEFERSERVMLDRRNPFDEYDDVKFRQRFRLSKFAVTKLLARRCILQNICDVYVGGKVRVSEFMIFLDLQHCGSK